MAKATTKKSAAAATGRMSLRGQLSLGALVAELLGSAVLAFAALTTGNNPIIAAVAVIVVVLMFSDVSGAYLNPVVVIAAWATRQLSWVKAVGYVVVQVLGAMLAYVVVAKFMQDSSVYTLFTPADQAQSLQQMGQPVHTPGQWKPIFGEFVGALIFSFGIASALLGKKAGFDKAFTIGGALMLGLVAALAGSYAVVNPAVATALSGFAQGGWWSFGAYALAPLVGGAFGAWVFKFIKKDAEIVSKAD